MRKIRHKIKKTKKIIRRHPKPEKLKWGIIGWILGVLLVAAISCPKFGEPRQIELNNLIVED